MADSGSKTQGNVPGPYYVDENCIDCGVCTELAPDNFGTNEDEGYAYVKKQPEGDEEASVREALDECPVDAIGDDG